MTYLTTGEIKAWQPESAQWDGLTPLERARVRMEKTGQWAPWQVVGRRMAIGCVALEVTQRCNLDCNYCYLSESSEALKDIPLEEVLRRIDMIFAHYGPNTDVQVTGGDPTLRKREELVAIVRYIKLKNMRSSLFTNGIRATRDLLRELSDAGLDDVAFHVDMTQEREGYDSEIALNEVRQEYVERARGLPLSVFFNTTVYPGNFHEIAELVKFFVKHSDVVRLCGFQIGADTGRGALRERVALSPAAVQAQIEAGLGTRLEFGACSAGHAQCNRYAYGLVIDGKVYDFFNDPDFVQEILMQSSHIVFDRTSQRRTLERMTGFLLAHPQILVGFVSRAAKAAWAMRSVLVAARGRVGKLSFHIHNFMDACHLERERAEACSFMVMTPDGPLSMCVHNARRDDYLLVPSEVTRNQQVVFWHPVTGKFQNHKPDKIEVELTRKNARGRAKKALAEVITEG